MRFKGLSFAAVALVCASAFSALAFLPPQDTAGPLTLSIDGPGDVRAFGQAVRIRVTVKNSGPDNLEGDVRVAVIDDWKVADGDLKPFTVGPGGEQSLAFDVIPGRASYTALYPVHAYAEFQDGHVQRVAHAVLITSVSASTPDVRHLQSPILIGARGGIPESAADRLARRQQALDQARSALHGPALPWTWKLESDAGVTGASVVPGPSGLADAFITFVNEGGEVVFDGFMMEVDGRLIGTTGADLQCVRVESRFEAGDGSVTGYVAQAGGAALALQARIWAEKGALRIAFGMPGARRDLRGEPRFTALGIGSASQLARRVYAGFGNVLQDPGPFDLQAGGFTLSTRHVGVDFKNGLSMVQATDIFPDRFHVDPAKLTYSLVAHHDATFSFVPSTHGAFAAARVYRFLAGFKPAGAVANLLGRVCLDQWEGDYRAAAQDLEMAARYGLTDAVFVKHVWQRWGFDYRLPDIYPPEGNPDDFLAMVAACKRHGILFCPHDNYIDAYPDAPGFTYDNILFNEDGTPQKAWLNRAREAQSYRWSPNAFNPSLEANLKLIKAAFAPTAYFLDVFGAIAPVDFYDRQGRFYPKTATAQRWGEAFDRIRGILGGNAPTISEAGHDGLIGHLDGGEADHSGWLPGGVESDALFRWRMKAGDGERVPWHDMASHGDFVLFAGGLGSRYAGGQDEILHGYGSDDYLCLTVLGGRDPMCGGPFSRRAVMTYWLLHDLCNSLAHSEMLADDFAGDDIHRQMVRFSGEGAVRVNRGKVDWFTGGQVLPEFGFIAAAGGNEADITRRGGVISACAKSPGVLFVDARPDVPDGQVSAKVTSVEDLGGGRFRVRIDWKVLQPAPAGFRPFLQFVGSGGTNSEGILFQGGLDLDPAKLGSVGTYPSMADVTLPAGFAAPAGIAIRFGLYHPGSDGGRLPIAGPMDHEKRARGGTLLIDGKTIRWLPEPPDPVLAARAARLNTDGKMVDFGAAATNGAFRLLYGGAPWRLIPLPASSSFKVSLRLDQLKAAGRKVINISELDANGSVADKAVAMRQVGQTVDFETAPGVFAYQISLTN